MTSLTVDMSSLPDLLEGLRQIQVEIRRAYDSEFPAGSTPEFADSLWDRIRGSELTALVRCMLDVSRRQEYFTLNEVFDALRIAGLSYDLIADLTAIELELGGRLVGEHWVQEHLTSCCWVHHEVRERLLCLMAKPRVTLPAS
jgi:hypothetical protein